MHISHHLLQCKPHTDKIQLKEHKRTGCWLKTNNESSIPLPKRTPGWSIKEPPFISGHGETSQSLCKKLSRNTTRIKIPESSASRNVNQNLSIHAFTVQTLLAFDKERLSEQLTLVFLFCHQIHRTFRPNSSTDY